MVTPIACRWLLECRSCWAPSPCEALVTRIPRGMFSTQTYASPGKGGVGENSPVLRITSTERLNS